MSAVTSSTEPVSERYCSDCGCAVHWQGEATIAKGSTVREPGEALCNSCSAHRTKMVREVMALPDKLCAIRARYGRTV